MENNEKKEESTFLYTEEQLMARLKFFIGICLSMTLTGIVFVVLYSLIFVTQPLNAMSPIDQKFFELIVPIATFLTGTLSGIMLAGNDKDSRMKAIEAATRAPVVSAPPPPPPPQAPLSSNPFMSKPLEPSSFMTPVSGGMPVASMTPAAPAAVTSIGGKLAPPPAPQPEL